MARPNLRSGGSGGASNAEKQKQQEKEKEKEQQSRSFTRRLRDKIDPRSSSGGNGGSSNTQSTDPHRTRGGNGRSSNTSSSNGSSSSQQSSSNTQSTDPHRTQGGNGASSASDSSSNGATTSPSVGQRAADKIRDKTPTKSGVVDTAVRGAEKVRETVGNQQRSEQYGDVDWSLGFGGPGDEVEAATKKHTENIQEDIEGGIRSVGGQKAVDVFGPASELANPGTYVRGLQEGAELFHRSNFRNPEKVPDISAQEAQEGSKAAIDWSQENPYKATGVALGVGADVATGKVGANSLRRIGVLSDARRADTFRTSSQLGKFGDKGSKKTVDLDPDGRLDPDPPHSQTVDQRRTKVNRFLDRRQSRQSQRRQSGQPEQNDPVRRRQPEQNAPPSNDPPEQIMPDRRPNPNPAREMFEGRAANKRASGVRKGQPAHGRSAPEGSTQNWKTDTAADATGRVDDAQTPEVLKASPQASGGGPTALALGSQNVAGAQNRRQAAEEMQVTGDDTLDLQGERNEMFNNGQQPGQSGDTSLRDSWLDRAATRQSPTTTTPTRTDIFSGTDTGIRSDTDQDTDQVTGQTTRQTTRQDTPAFMDSRNDRSQTPAFDKPLTPDNTGGGPTRRPRRPDYPRGLTGSPRRPPRGPPSMDMDMPDPNEMFGSSSFDDSYTSVRRPIESFGEAPLSSNADVWMDNDDDGDVDDRDRTYWLNGDVESDGTPAMPWETASGKPNYPWEDGGPF